MTAPLLAGCLQQSTEEASADIQPKVTVSELAGGGFRVDGTGTTNPDGAPLTFAWDWERDQSDQPAFDLVPPAEMTHGTLMLGLVVRDEHGHAATTMEPLTIGSGANQAPMLMMDPDTNRWVKPGTVVTLDASASHDMDGDAVTFEWIWGPRGDFQPDLWASPPDMFQPQENHQVFSTGALDADDSFDYVFANPGTYNLVCHPHPWMKGRIVVTNDTVPADAVVLPIRDYAFGNGTTTIAPGTKVTFENQDPTTHTASVENWLPGTMSGGNEGMFQQPIPEGEHVARLILRDPNGGQYSATWGIKASEDAPEEPLVRTWRNATTDPPLVGATPAASVATAAFEAPHVGQVNATLAWPNPGSASSATLTLMRGTPGQAGETVTGCAAPAAAAADPGRAVLVCRLPAATGSYWFQVTATNGVVQSWRVDATVRQFAAPGFGDTAAGGHQH